VDGGSKRKLTVIHERTTRRKSIPENRKKKGPWESLRKALFFASKKSLARKARIDVKPPTVVLKRV